MRDIISVEKRIEKLEKTARVGDKDSKEELVILNFIYPKMNEGMLIHDMPLDSNQKNCLRTFSLLTNKPTLYVLNVDEDEISAHERSPAIQQLFDFIEKRGNRAIRLCGKLESEISALPEDEKNHYLIEYNLQESGLTKLIHASYKLLNLETFFTVSEKEARAWTIKKGVSAPEAAGEIHTDMEHGFIKAEVYTLGDLIQYKSEQALKDAGKIRLEGKNYIVQDGDIIFFKFNV